jgi:putative membrane protein
MPLPAVLLGWYVAFGALLGVAPADRHTWILTSILPTLLVGALVITYRRFPLAHASYVMLGVFLTLHTIGVHYTYSRVPAGEWLAAGFGLGRNPFDRLVHFAFGLLLTYPLFDLFGRLRAARGLWRYYLAAATSVALSGLWEVLESWVAQVVSPERGAVYLGSQGDPWDAQHDIEVAVVGTLLAVLVIAAVRAARRRTSASGEAAPSLTTRS